MFFDPARHEPLNAPAWDENEARNAIAHIVSDTEARFTPAGLWPVHPHDGPAYSPAPLTPLYYGAWGVAWALDYLNNVGAARTTRDYREYYETWHIGNRAWLDTDADRESASFLMGETPGLMLEYGHTPSAALADRIATGIAGNIRHPSRELMWGSPGTLLASLFLFQRTQDERWADLFRESADVLWSQLHWSDNHACHYWNQDMYGQQSTYLDGVHGFVGTALPLIRGRKLLSPDKWQAWQQCIVNTIQRTATVEGEFANWRVMLDSPEDDTHRWLMQFCHGAPGFIVCLADLPTDELDSLLIAGGEATWAAGPLAKGSNLCHGTGGNGYAFLVLYQRTGQAKWLERARAFAMHGIQQSLRNERAFGQQRYSLWTGDPGFAVYLWDCLRGQAAFPTLDVFYA